MNPNLDPIGVLETAPRQLKQGHTLRRSKTDGMIRVWCEGPGCNFRIEQLIENTEIVEYLAWKHRTEPRLLLPGTSDIQKATRMLSLEQELKRERK